MDGFTPLSGVTEYCGVHRVPIFRFMTSGKSTSTIESIANAILTALISSVFISGITLSIFIRIFLIVGKTPKYVTNLFNSLSLFSIGKCHIYLSPLHSRCSSSPRTNINCARLALLITLLKTSSFSRMHTCASSSFTFSKKSNPKIFSSKEKTLTNTLHTSTDTLYFFAILESILYLSSVLIFKGYSLISIP